MSRSDAVKRSRWAPRLAWIAAATCAFALSGSVDARAQDEPVAWGYAMAHDLMSPFCPGRTLSQCTSPQAAELRQWIIVQAAAGATRAEVEEMLISRYGEGILQAPKAEGLGGVSVYAIPIVFFLVGGVVVYWLIRRLTAPASQAAVSTPLATSGIAATGIALDPDPELERLVEEELERG